jgi:hypothetical protein
MGSGLACTPSHSVNTPKLKILEKSATDRRTSVRTNIVKEDKYFDGQLIKRCRIDSCLSIIEHRFGVQFALIFAVTNAFQLLADNEMNFHSLKYPSFACSCRIIRDATPLTICWLPTVSLRPIYIYWSVFVDFVGRSFFLVWKPTCHVNDRTKPVHINQLNVRFANIDLPS